MKRFNKVLPRSSRAGYTLVEVIVAAGIAAFAVASAFAFARYQMTSIRTQTEVTKMNASSALIFQQLRRDLDSAGFGTSFWVGAPNSAFSNQANEVTFANYGVPSFGRPTTSPVSEMTSMTRCLAQTSSR